MTDAGRIWARLAGGAAPVLALLAAAPTLAAQEERLTGYRTAAISPTYQAWSFSGDLYQLTLSGGDSVRVGTATQWSVPIMVALPLGARWTLDLSGAYAASTITLKTRDPELDTDRYAVRGFVDTRIRVTGRFAGDNLLFTAGYNAPTGATSLNSEELAALRTVASPALSFQAPTLGAGGGGTAGLVFARQIMNWAWALGASYEYRATYTPVALAAGLPTLDFNPSDAVHLSLAGDGVLGAHGMTLVLSADLFAADKLSAESQAAPAVANTKLGPIYSAEWQFRVGAARLRELTLFVTERYRSSYERGGVTVPQSSGNYLDAGVRAVLPAGQRTGFMVGVTGRHQTGLKADRSLATAAMVGAGLTLGVVHTLEGGYLLQPFARGQLGRIETGDNSASARELAAGLTLGRRF
jgi:hypothetical protein